MPFRTWVIAAAFGLVAFTALGQAQNETDNSADGATVKQSAPEPLPLPFPVQIIEDDETAKARERREAIAEKNEADDLAAQQGMNAATQAMNEATQSMMWASWVSAGLVLIGTALLVWTLRLTRQANRAAQKAVGVASEANRILQQEQRPWLDFEIGLPDISESTVKGKSVFSITLTANITNLGRTPALYVYALSGVHISNEMIENTGFYGRILEVSQGFTGFENQLVFPNAEPTPVGASTIQHQEQFSGPDGAVVRAEITRLIVGVFYRDSFGNKFATCKTYPMSSIDGGCREYTVSYSTNKTYT